MPRPAPAAAISVRIALLRDGASFGAILWAVALTVGALAVAATLTWRAHWLRPFAAGATATVSSTSSGRR